MSKIETEIWEPIPEKKGMVRYVGQRKTADVFKELKEFLQEESLGPDEYLDLVHDFKKRFEYFPEMEDIQCYAQWGGSEGIYLTAILVTKIEGKLEHVPFVTGKTLEESAEAYDRMQYIAGRIYQAFMGEHATHGRYKILPSNPEPESITYDMLTEKLETECRDALRKRLLHNEESLAKIAGELGLMLQILDVLQEPSMFESLSEDKKKELYETEDILQRLYEKAGHIREADRYEIEDIIASARALVTESEGRLNFTPELTENAYYGFTCFSRMKYRDTLRAGLIDEIVFGIYVRNEGCISEATIGWEELGGSQVMYIRAYDDGLQAAYSPKFLEVIQKLKEGDSYTPEAVSRLLISEGFEDCSDEPLLP